MSATSRMKAGLSRGAKSSNKNLAAGKARMAATMKPVKVTRKGVPARKKGRG